MEKIPSIKRLQRIATKRTRLTHWDKKILDKVINHLSQFADGDKCLVEMSKTDYILFTTYKIIKNKWKFTKDSAETISQP
jgi:hypothetical protein